MIRLLLRPRESFTGAPGPATARVLARADRHTAAPGWRSQLLRAFAPVPSKLPVAALTRQLDCNDAEHGSWLRADPAYVRADMSTARLMACGDLGLSAEEVAQLLQPLKPLFGDAGFPISAPLPQRWYLALPRETQLPAFADPHEALGAPLDDYLPAGDAGRRWRHLLNEAQIVLHNHPLNAERERAGKLPVNSLWFWGAGPLPDQVRTTFTRVFTDDVLLRALAQCAGIDARTTRSDARSPFDTSGRTGGAAVPEAEESARIASGNGDTRRAVLPEVSKGERQRGARIASGKGDTRRAVRPEVSKGERQRGLQPGELSPHTLIDLRDLLDATALEHDWIAPALATGTASLQLDFGDGAQLDYRPAHRWRIWRRAGTFA